MLSTSPSVNLPVIVAEHHQVTDYGDEVSYGLMEGHDTRGIDPNRVAIYLSHATPTELIALRTLSSKYSESEKARSSFHEICIRIIARRPR